MLKNQSYTRPMSDIGFIQQGLQHMQLETGIESTLNELVQLAVSAARSEAGSLFLLDEEQQVLKHAVSVGLPDDYVKGCGDVPLGEQCCGRAAKFNKAWVVSDMLTDPLFASAREASIKSGIRAAFSVPVIEAQGKVLGSLACHYREPFTPSPYEIERNHVFATLIAFALVREWSQPKKNAQGS
jgi:GAF domain-containing protein